MTDPWNTDEDNTVNAVEVGNTQVTIEGEVTAEDVMEAARDNGIKKFHPKDEEGNELSQEDFPVNHNVRVSEYNENA